MNDSANNISVIVPLLNERKNLPKLHKQLGRFSFSQVIWVDGGSSDGSWEWLQDNSSGANEITIQAQSSGRAFQMNKGSMIAISSHLLFLHADSILPEKAIKEINQGLINHHWGRFNINFFENDFRMKIVAWFMNHRSRLTSIATGDQAIFVRNESFKQIDGFPDIALMEDVELCKRLKHFGKPFCSSLIVKTSARRWLKNGVIKTIFLMWRLRFLYTMGVSPEELAAEYRNVR